MWESVKSVEYGNLNREIKRAMKRSANDMVQTGCLLRRMLEEKLWEAEYDCFDEYLEKELHMDYSMASRFIGINKKYSIDGAGMEIAAKWEGFSQSVLIEMLSMPPELEEKVTPDMTVKQVREIKRREKQKNVKMRPDVRGIMDYAYCAGCGTQLDEDGRPPRCPECGQLQDWEWYMNTCCPREGEGSPMDIPDTVVEGEYREIEEGEGIATSQPEETPQVPELVKPDKRQCKYLDAFAKYFISSKKDWMLEDFQNRVEDVSKSPEEMKRHLGANNRNWFFSVDDGAAHIDLFDDFVQLWDENSDHMGDFEWFYLAAAIQRMWNDAALEELAGTSEAGGHEEEAEKRDPAQDDELARIRGILEREKKLLDDYLEAGGLPEMTVFRQKTIVGALAGMVCDLENVRREEEPEQPEPPAMTNDKSRAAFVDSYKEWPVWIDTRETGERYYRYQFPNGTSFVVKVYFHRCFDYKSTSEKYEDRFHEDWGSEEYYILIEGKHFRDCRYNKSAMVDFLRDLQKKGAKQ